MIKTLFILSLLFASIWLGVQLHHDAGYVLIMVRHVTIESTLWVALFALVILFILLHYLLISYRRASLLPASMKNWRLKHRAERAQNKTTKGLIAFSEGYWKRAKTELIQALPHTETPLINYLIAARAAQELGQNKLRDDYLREAQQSMPDAKIAVELTQAQLQLAHKQWEQALATLKHLHDLAPKHPYVLKLLAHLYEAIEDWPQLIELLPALKKNQALLEKTLTALTERAYCKTISQQTAQKDWHGLEKQITSLPKPLKFNPAIMAIYGDALIAQEKFAEAENTLRRSLQKHLDESLLNIYRKLPANTLKLSFLEGLLKQHQHSAALHHCLGICYQTKQLYGKAQTHLEQSIQLHPSAEAYYALGKLFETMDDTKKAFVAYQKGCQSFSTESS